MQGRRQYLWRAVDQDGDVLDILLQSRKDKRTAKRFFRKLLKGQERTPIELMTDKLPSYCEAKRKMMPSVVHCQDKYANNRAEVSHEHTCEQERQTRGFESSGQAQRFLSVHGQAHNLFRVGRHLLRAVNYRVLRGRAFATWQEVTCAQ
ncbi:MAG: IS6 family transposase [Gammaproteobacteria bacterium]|nr:IS6 family transposase [Gammaproteobacteria bacterium]